MNRRIMAVSAALNLAFFSFILGGWLGPNVLTNFNPDVEQPRVDSAAYVHPLASVTGDVILGARVYVAPSASVRGDEGQGVFVGDESNVQDGVVVHGLETWHEGHAVEKHQVEKDGVKYSVYIGKKVSLAHQSQVHGPAKVGDGTFIGMQALVFKAELGDNVVVEPGAKVIGVKIKSNRYVPAGMVLTRQADADALPEISDAYAFKSLPAAVVEVNTQLADGYNGKKQYVQQPTGPESHEAAAPAGKESAKSKPKSVEHH